MESALFGQKFFEEGANVSVATVNQEASDKHAITRQKGVTFTTFLQMQRKLPPIFVPFGKVVVHYIYIDMANRKSVQALVDKAVELQSRIDVLMNLAGVFKDERFEKLTEELLSALWPSI